jgi:hypothetical protein
MNDKFVKPIFFLIFFSVFFTVVKISAQPFFDRDRKSDLGVFRPSENNWYVLSSENNFSQTINFGLSTDRLVPADYDGDGLTDIAVWRSETGVWYVLRSSNGLLQTIYWGARRDVGTGFLSDEPAVGDYDGDGHDDFAVWRPETGVWYLLKSSSGFNPDYAVSFNWGKFGDVPVPADFDGDKKADFAIFRPSENRWYVFQSSSNSWKTSVFGQSGYDLLVPADYTGDGKADFAIYRQGLWLIQNSESGSVRTFQFGLATDFAASADYTGDGITDLAVFRDGVWFVYDINSERIQIFYYGTSGDVPLAWLKVKPSIVAVP